MLEDVSPKKNSQQKQPYIKWVQMVEWPEYEPDHSVLSNMKYEEVWH
jgi:hypothetical protein